MNKNICYFHLLEKSEIEEIEFLFEEKFWEQINDFWKRVLSVLIWPEYNFSIQQAFQILDWDNSPFEILDKTLSKVDNILSFERKEALDNIRISLKEQRWIECYDWLKYLWPKEFRKIFLWNELVEKSFYSLYWVNFTTIDKNSYDHKEQSFNRAYRKLKQDLDLEKKEKSYYKEIIKDCIWVYWVRCPFSLSVLWLNFLYNDKSFLKKVWSSKWLTWLDYIFRISVKKVFWKSRLKDVSNSLIIEELWLTEKSISYYKTLSLKDLEDNFWFYDYFVEDYWDSWYWTNKELSKTIYSFIWAKYFFQKILWKNKNRYKDWDNLSNDDIVSFLVWAWYKTISSIEEKNIDSKLFLLNKLKIKWINNWFVFSKLKIYSLEKIFKEDSLFKYHIKKTIWKNLCELNSEDMNNLNQFLFSECFDENYLINFLKAKLNILWVKDKESFLKTFWSSRQRRKFINKPWNEVFIFAFNHILVWGCSNHEKLTKDDLEKLIDFLNL